MTWGAIPRKLYNKYAIIWILYRDRDFFFKCVYIICLIPHEKLIPFLHIHANCQGRINKHYSLNSRLFSSYKTALNPTRNRTHYLRLCFLYNLINNISPFFGRLNKVNLNLQNISFPVHEPRLSRSVMKYLLG